MWEKEKKLKKKLCIIMSLLLLLCSISVTEEFHVVTANAETINNYGLQDNIQDGVILHCFDWTYNDIRAELPNIAKAGFTSIQTSPAQTGVNSGIWYWLYQPLGFSVSSNDLGTRSELQQLCTEAERYGIKVIVDVVANHLAGNHTNIQSDLKDSKYWHTMDKSIIIPIATQSLTVILECRILPQKMNMYSNWFEIIS